MNHPIHIGDGLRIRANDVEVRGDGCLVQGNRCVVAGNDNTVIGISNRGKGNGNHVVGDHNEWRGRGNRLIGVDNLKNGRKVPPVVHDPVQSDEIVQEGDDVWVNGVLILDESPPRAKRRRDLISVPDAPDDDEPGSVKEGDACSICLGSRKTCASFPCGHNCMCPTCARAWTEGKRRGEVNCPVCRAPIDKIKRVFN